MHDSIGAQNYKSRFQNLVQVTARTDEKRSLYK